MPSFGLLEAGGWKASYVSSRERLGSAVLTGDWRFSALSCASTREQFSL